MYSPNIVRLGDVILNDDDDDNDDDEVDVDGSGDDG